MGERGVPELESRLANECEKLKRLTDAAQDARAKSEAATPGGLTDYDSAVLSGIRRRPNRKGDAQRFAAYDREAAASKALIAQQELVERLGRRVAKAKRDADAPRDLDALAPGWYVRDRFGWSRVVRVNAKSVTVETPWSWTDRWPFDRVIETRQPLPEGVTG